MAIALTGPEGYFTRLGRLIAGINEANAYQGDACTARTSAIASGHLLTQKQVLDGLYSRLDSQRGSNSGWQSYLADLASSTLVAQFLADSPPLPSSDTVAALGSLVRQMKATGQTIAESSLGSSVSAAAGNLGNGTVVVGLGDPADGRSLDYLHAESVRLTCSADSYPGGSATAGSEPFAVEGQIAADGDLAWNWPAGSGVTGTLVAVPPDSSLSLVANGGFNNWPDAALPPTGWSVAVGAVGTTVARSTTSYANNYAATFVGNGSELTSIRQDVQVQPVTQYHFLAMVRSSGGVAAGVLNVRLLSGSGAVLADNGGTAISFTQSVASLTTTYQPMAARVLTPTVLPSRVVLEVRLSTAMTSGAVLFIDHLSLTPAFQLYAGGPYLTVFAGNVPFAAGDSFSVTLTNSAGVNTFARGMDRIFGLKSLGVKIPSSSSPTIPNSLIS